MCRSILSLSKIANKQQTGQQKQKQDNRKTSGVGVRLGVTGKWGGGWGALTKYELTGLGNIGGAS